MFMSNDRFRTKKPELVLPGRSRKTVCLPPVTTTVTTAVRLKAGRVSGNLYLYLRSKLTTRNFHFRTASTTTGMQAITSGG